MCYCKSHSLALADIHWPVLGVERKIGCPLPLVLGVDLLDGVVTSAIDGISYQYTSLASSFGAGQRSSRVTWNYLHNGGEDLDHLHLGQVLAGTRRPADTPLFICATRQFLPWVVAECPLECPLVFRIPRLTGMKYFSREAMSGASHRSGLNSRASGPQISWERCITWAGGQLIILMCMIQFR